MSEERIALAVIAGDSAIEEGFERMLRSVAGKVHGVFVAYTGTKGGEDKLVELVDPEIFPEGVIAPVGWAEDFALARNQSFDLVYEHMAVHSDVPDSQFDWIIWLDCDDVIPEHVDLQAQIRILRKKRAHGAFVNYNYSLDPKTGVVFVSHMKERIFRTDVSWNWDWPIHESCHGPIATRMAQLDAAEFSVNHLRNDVSRRPRNRAIIERWYKQDEDNLRAKMMMAHELKAEAEALPSSPERHAALNAALMLYRDYIAVSEPDDDSFACNRYVADILMQLGRINDSINIDLQGVKMQPTWPASYVGIAETLYRSGDYEGAIQWADVTLRACEVPKTLHVFNNLDLNYRPLMFKASALRKLGRFDEALRIYREEASQYLHDQFLEDQITETIQEAQAHTAARSEDDVRAIHDLNWGKQPEKSIAFFLVPHVEPWNPETLKKSGLGGTETCVIKLAEELGSRGWRVAIYGEPGNWNGRTVNNVEWYHSSFYHPDQPFTAVVSVRFPPIFDAKVNAEVKLLWLHDVNVGDIRYLDGFDRFEEIDAVITPSDWHALHTRRVYGDFNAKSVAITNGFDRELFRYSEDDALRRDPNRMVYASSPDRGLERLLDLWPKIREQMPNAWLEIFYGWDTIDAIINDGAAHGPQLMAFKKRILTMIENLGGREGGIFWRGRVGQETLSVSLRKASVMPYPANFMETFGIVFAQAMTAGCIPVVPDLGALPDLVEDPHLVINGAPDSENFGERFVEAVVREAQATDGFRRSLSHTTEPYVWSNVTDAWEALLAEHIANNRSVVA